MQCGIRVIEDKKMQYGIRVAEGKKTQWDIGWIYKV